MASINDSVKIQAPLGKAMEALTTQRGYNGWWSKDCQIPEAPGGLASLRFNKGGTIVSMQFRVDDIDPAGKVVWTCTAHDQASWVGTTLRWTVVPAGTGVEVRLEHAGWKDTGPEMVAQGWAHFLKSMKSYLETGVGEPW
jgi:uncharacterized protein YndB with AHSA1/START domain